jgi:hypothetical protein
MGNLCAASLLSSQLVVWQAHCEGSCELVTSKSFVRCRNRYLSYRAEVVSNSRTRQNRKLTWR